MNWRDRAARIVGDGPADELTKPTKAQPAPLLSVLSVPACALYGEKDKLTPDMEGRHVRLIAMLRDNPTIRYAVITDTESAPDSVIVALAIRGVATCEIHIPREQFDPFALLDMAGRYSGTLH